MPATDDPVLLRLRTALDAACGDRTERIVLFGSRARGDFRPDSDYDVALFLEGRPDLGESSRTLSGIEIEIHTGAVVNALALPAGAHHARTAFMAELRRDGVDL